MPISLPNFPHLALICFPRYEVVKLHTCELANRQRRRCHILVIGRPNFPPPHRAWFAFEVLLLKRVINSPVSNCLSSAYGPPKNLPSHLVSLFLLSSNWNTFKVSVAKVSNQFMLPIVDLTFSPKNIAYYEAFLLQSVRLNKFLFCSWSKNFTFCLFLIET